MSLGDQVFLVMNCLEGRGGYAGSEVINQVPAGDWSGGRKLAVVKVAPANAAEIRLSVYVMRQMPGDWAEFSGLRVVRWWARNAKPGRWFARTGEPPVPTLRAREPFDVLRAASKLADLRGNGRKARALGWRSVFSGLPRIVVHDSAHELIEKRNSEGSIAVLW